MSGLYQLRPREIWAFFTRQPASFWLACIYMLFEYVRPQAIYPALSTLPWAKAVILLGLVAFIAEGGGIKAKNPINLWVGIFSIAVILSWTFAQYPADSQAKIPNYINWVIAYILVANTAATEGKFFVFFLLFMLASLKMSQHGTRTWLARGFGFANWGATGAPGWFHNSGEFGIQMCIFFPMSIYLIGALQRHWEKWKRIAALALPATAVASVMATNSRGAMLGLAAVGLWILLRTRYRVRGLVALGTLSVVVYLGLPEKSRERFTTMGDDATSESRITYWKNGIQTYKAHPVTGIGYENWASYYEDNYGRTALPHNIFIQAGAELGTIGFLALLGLIGSSFLVNARTRKVTRGLGERGHFMEMTARGLDGAMIGFVASAFFVTVLYYPYLWFALALTSALHAAALREARAVPATPVAAARPLATGPGWRSLRSVQRRAAAPGRAPITEP